MPPNGRSWKELTWSWAYSTGHPASDQKLEAAARSMVLRYPLRLDIPQ